MSGDISFTLKVISDGYEARRRRMRIIKWVGIVFGLLAVFCVSGTAIYNLLISQKGQAPIKALQPSHPASRSVFSPGSRTISLKDSSRKSSSNLALSTAADNSQAASIATDAEPTRDSVVKRPFALARSFFTKYWKVVLPVTCIAVALVVACIVLAVVTSQQRSKAVDTTAETSQSEFEPANHESPASASPAATVLYWISLVSIPISIFLTGGLALFVYDRNNGDTTKALKTFLILPLVYLFSTGLVLVPVLMLFSYIKLRKTPKHIIDNESTLTKRYKVSLVITVLLLPFTLVAFVCLLPIVLVLDKVLGISPGLFGFMIEKLEGFFKEKRSMI